MSQPSEQPMRYDPRGDEALDIWSDPRYRQQAQPVTGLNMLDRAFSTLTAPSVSGLDPREVSLWADYSHWNGDIDLSKTQPWIHGAMFKASDGRQMYKGDFYDKENYKDKTLDRNIQQAYDLGIPCIPYHYFHFVLEPGWTEQTILDWQYDRIMHALKNKIPGKSFHAFALDIEEGNDSSTNAKSKVEKMTDRLRAALGVKIIHYSRVGILNMFPALRDWLSYDDSRDLWLAQYVFTGRVKLAFEKLYSDYISKVNMRVVTPGFATWRWVQFAACFELPGCTVNYTDLNFFKGTKEQCYSWLGYKQSNPPVEPPPVDPPVDPPVTDPDLDELIQAVNDQADMLDALEKRVDDLEKFRENVKAA